MYRCLLVAFPLLVITLLTSPGTFADPLRIIHLQRCGNLLDNEHLHYCLHVRGLQQAIPRLLLDGQQLSTRDVERTEQGLRLRLAELRRQVRSR